jgi:hypothetical protein
MDYLEQIANQGFGYLLFAGALIVIGMLFRALVAEKEKRIQDGVRYTEIYVSNAKDLLSSQAILQRSVDAIVDLLDKIRWKGR